MCVALFSERVRHLAAFSCGELTDLRSKRGRRRRDGSQSIPLFVLFVLFGQAKRTLKEKLLYASSRANNVRPYKQNPSIANKQNKNYTSVFRQRTDFTHARPAFIAGVQTMRARICSAFSCDMFARVVWLRLRRAAKPPTFALPFAARTRHAWLVRQTRARRTRFGRRTA